MAVLESDQLAEETVADRAGGGHCLLLVEQLERAAGDARRQIVLGERRYVLDGEPLAPPLRSDRNRADLAQPPAKALPQQDVVRRQSDLGRIEEGAGSPHP